MGRNNTNLLQEAARSMANGPTASCRNHEYTHKFRSFGSKVISDIKKKALRMD
jgi:hypothetical protein